MIVEFVETLLLMPKLAVIENTWKSDTLVCSNEYFIILRFLLVSMLKVSESHTVLSHDSSSVMDFFPQILIGFSLILSLSGEGSVAPRAWHVPLEILWVEDIYIIQSFINIVR